MVGMFVLCVLLAKSLPSGSFLFSLRCKAINSYLSLGENKQVSLCRICVVGIVRKVQTTINKTQQQTSPQWWAVCPFHGVGSMDRPNPTQGTSYKGVSQGRFVWVLLNLVKEKALLFYFYCYLCFQQIACPSSTIVAEMAPIVDSGHPFNTNRLPTFYWTMWHLV